MQAPETHLQVVSRRAEVDRLDARSAVRLIQVHAPEGPSSGCKRKVNNSDDRTGRTSSSPALAHLSGTPRT
eukprot:561696-Rhodomonas_salina.1